MSHHRHPILICYDGSPESASAIQHAGDLFAPDRALVLTVCTTTRAGDRFAARRLARAGVRLARDVGLQAEARIVITTTPVPKAVMAVAQELQSPVIVVGSRGRSAASAALLGSISQALVHHSEVPVLVCRRRLVRAESHEQAIVDAELASGSRAAWAGA